MMGRFVTDAVLVVIIVAAILTIAATLDVDEEPYEESGNPYARTMAVE